MNLGAQLGPMGITKLSPNWACQMGPIHCPKFLLSGVRVDEDRVEQGIWIVNDGSVLYVNDMTLYSIRSGILCQWSFLRTGVMWWCFGVLVTARARASILNSLEAVYLGGVYERITVVHIVI